MDNLRDFFENLIKNTNDFGQPTLVKIIFGGLRKKSTPYKKVTMRPIEIGNEIVFQAEYFHENKAFHKNLKADEAIETALSLLKTTSSR